MINSQMVLGLGSESQFCFCFGASSGLYIVIFGKIGYVSDYEVCIGIFDKIGYIADIIWEAEYIVCALQERC